MGFGRRCSTVLPVRALGGLAAPLAVLALGCTTVSKTPSQSALMQATGTKVSVLSMRATQNLLAVQVPGTIEATADSIAAQTTDVKVRRRALLWKIELVPTFYQALFNADPLAAAMDTYTLCLQVEAYFETGAGREELAPFQPLVIGAAKHARSQVETALKAVAASPEGFQRAEAFAETWATAHPISGPPLSSRPSVLNDLADMAAGGDKNVSVFQVVGDLPATVDDIATRLDIYTAYLPNAGRWQAELLADEMADRAESQRVLTTFASVKEMAERIRQLLSQEALQNTLDVASLEVRKERLAAFASVESLRKEMEAYVTSEREAALLGVGAERRAVMSDLGRERLALMEQVDALRKQTLLDADQLANRIIWRGSLVAALLLVLAAGLAVFVVRHGARAKA